MTAAACFKDSSSHRVEREKKKTMAATYFTKPRSIVRRSTQKPLNRPPSRRNCRQSGGEGEEDGGGDLLPMENHAKTSTGKSGSGRRDLSLLLMTVPPGSSSSTTISPSSSLPLLHIRRNLKTIRRSYADNRFSSW
ncbi:unnamed protein product [Linum trigynum]|uniref:Uncharacterized protein n=1 Tax=Linum trigynum TaxID=586398 RepID=A0AAV2CKK4_9ROSI